MVPWTITAASLMEKLLLHQQTEVSEQTITLWPPMKKERKVFPTSFQKEL